MDAQSEDLREEVVAAIERRTAKVRAARLFGMGPSLVRRYAGAVGEVRSLALKKRSCSRSLPDQLPWRDDHCSFMIGRTKERRFLRRGGRVGLWEAMRADGAGRRWFVRGAAVIVGLANLRVFVWWFGHPSGVDGSWVLGAGVSFSDALPSVAAVSVAALATSELFLRRFGREIVSAEYARRYAAAVGALCVGGALAGGLVAGLWAIDGTLGADPSAGDFASPAKLVGAMVGALLSGLLGAGVGFGFGLVQGAVLAFPLAAALGWFGDGRPRAGPPSSLVE